MSDYDTDFLTWTEQQADLLRRMAAGERVNHQVDWGNIAEEIESLGRSDRRELRSRIRSILLHLMKLQASSAAEPRAGWRRSILHQRIGIRTLLEDSPSLRPLVPAMIEAESADASSLAQAELQPYAEPLRASPSALRFTAEQVLGPWLPD